MQRWGGEIPVESSGGRSGDVDDSRKLYSCGKSEE